MNTYVGLDVSLKNTSICVVDEDGTMLSESTDKLSLIKSQWCNEKNKKPVQTSPLSS